MSYQHIHQGPYSQPGYAAPPPPGFFNDDYLSPPPPPPPPGPPRYQGYFDGDYPTPPPEHIYHQSGNYQDDIGCASFLRTCLATLCCCWILERCCCW